MSLMDELLSAASTLGEIADTPRAAITSALMGENPFEAAFDTSKRRSGRDMLEKWGVLGPNQEGLDEGDVLGFAAEQFMDPLNLIGGSALSKAAKALGRSRRTNREIAAFNEAARETNLFRQATRSKAAAMAPELERIAEIEKANAASLAQRAAGHMPEELARETKVVDEAGKPLKTYHGTQHVFGQYDPARADQDALYGPGHYTTTDPEIAGGGGGYVEKGPLPEKFRQRRGINQDRQSKLFHDISQVVAKDPRYKAAIARVEREELPADVADAILDNIHAEIVHTNPKAMRMQAIAERAVERAKVVAPQNVRMQFIHAKKPFKPDELIPIPEFQKLAKTDWAPKALDARHIHSIVSDVAKGITPEESYSMIGAWPEARETLSDLVLGNISEHDARRLLVKQLGTAPTSVPAQLLFDRGVGDAQRAIRDASYDAIVHTGGKITGGKPHKVVIAFDPSQIYKPYIAPAIQPVPPRPQLTDIERYIGLKPDLPLQAPVSEPHRRAAAILAALLAHNAVRNTADYQQVP